MTPLQQAFPGSIELHLAALEQALADSQAREEETKRQLDTLIIGFKRLEEKILELKNPSKNVPTLTPSIPSGWPPPPHYQRSSTEKDPVDRVSLTQSKPTSASVQNLSTPTKLKSLGLCPI